MLKILASFEIEVDGKGCRFQMEPNTPINVAKEMALAFLRYLGEIEDNAKAQMQAEEKPDESVKEQENLTTG